MSTGVVFRCWFCSKNIEDDDPYVILFNWARAHAKCLPHGKEEAPTQ